VGCHDGEVPWSPLPAEHAGSGPRPLREGIDGVLAGLGAPPASTFNLVVEHWSDLVGPEAASELRPVAVEHGRIVAVTRSPAWASQARWLEAGLVARAAELLGERVIEGLQVRVRDTPR